MNGSIEQMHGVGAYRAGVAAAATAAFITVWFTIVRDDGHGIGFFAVIMAAAIGGWSGAWRAAGLARAMGGAAVMQLLIGSLIATAPIVAGVPGESQGFMMLSGLFAALWLGAGALFHRAAKQR